MAFIVEDGSGLANANSYCEVAFADAYFLDRGNTVWPTLTLERKQAVIIQATDYVDKRFAKVFCGKKKTEEQALEFPRTTGLGIPELLKKAISEYAIRANTKELMTDPTLSNTGYALQSSRVKVGPIEKQETFASNISAGQITGIYPAADMLIEPLLCLSNYNRVIRN